MLARRASEGRRRKPRLRVGLTSRSNAGTLACASSRSKAHGRRSTSQRGLAVQRARQPRRAASPDAFCHRGRIVLKRSVDNSQRTTDEIIMKVGLVGYTGSGKSTLFLWLTGVEPDPAKIQQGQTGMSHVPDDRLAKMAA